MNKIFKNRKAFTLSELLIVVAIIAVLVAISIPIFSAQLEKAKRATDISNARSIRSALTLAINQNEIQILDNNTEIVLFVSENKTDGGVKGNYSNVLVNGKKYSGYKGIWEVVSKYGVSDTTFMKQKSDSIKWYAVSINGKGECYYYEGKGNQVDYKDSSVATKYDWNDLTD